MKVKLKVIKGRDTSYQGKAGRVERYSLTCSDPEETLLDNVDVIIPAHMIVKMGADAVTVKGKVVEFIVDGIREGFQRIELTATPVLP
jgi:hypothetical protein